MWACSPANLLRACAQYMHMGYWASPVHGPGEVVPRKMQHSIRGHGPLVGPWPSLLRLGARNPRIRIPRRSAAVQKERGHGRHYFLPQKTGGSILRYYRTKTTFLSLRLWWWYMQKVLTSLQLRITFTFVHTSLYAIIYNKKNMYPTRIIWVIELYRAKQ